MLGMNSGDKLIPFAVEGSDLQAKLMISAVRDTASNEIILKVVNAEDRAFSAAIDLPGRPKMELTATTLAGARPDLSNTDGEPPIIMPAVDRSQVSGIFSHQFPANSFTVLRLK